MCVVCNTIQNDVVDTALAVQNTIDGGHMAIPLVNPLEQLHTFEVIQSMLLNANLIALIF
tara:strand:+ start:182 stop:361 length:180 start_codon:yes stop_codon:yes gene_type:complete